MYNFNKSLENGKAKHLYIVSWYYIKTESAYLGVNLKMYTPGKSLSMLEYKCFE